MRESGLPPELGNLVLTVTGKCRLWNSERTEVARELCGHFLDGLESGTSPAELASAFGDARSTARLITASRKRLRPLWWRTWRVGLRAIAAMLAVCILAYAVLAARFWLYSPKVRRNYMQELNAQVLRTPMSERAWPLYIRAKVQFGPMPHFMMDGSFADPRRPGDADWEQYAQWLDSHREAVATAREGAAKASLGYLFRSTTDPEYARALELTSPGYKFDSTGERVSENPMMIGVLLPYLGEMRTQARRLQADAHLAADRGDSATFLADINALLGMAGQCLQEDFLISQQVAVAISDQAYITAMREADRPGLLDAAQLRNLAHTISAFAGGRISIDATGEMVMVEDILQRFYSDDGRGGGHFVGGPQMDALYDEWGVVRPRGLPLLRAVQPLQSAVLPGRREIMRMARGFVDAAAADDALPPWRHNERSGDKRYVELMNSGLYSVVPFLAALQGASDTGPISTACAARDLAETHRHAAMTVLALETFRRSQNRWPTTLAELVPTYLPAVPLDPFTGRPLRYLAPTLANQKPVLYSVGADAVDDGGAAPATKAGRSAVMNFQWFGPNPTPVTVPSAGAVDINIRRGDWVLWPEPPKSKDQ